MFVVKMFHTVAQTKLQLGHKCRMKCPILIRSFYYGVTEHSSRHHTACIHHDRYWAHDNKRTELEVVFCLTQKTNLQHFQALTAAIYPVQSPQALTPCRTTG